MPSCCKLRMSNSVDPGVQVPPFPLSTKNRTECPAASEIRRPIYPCGKCGKPVNVMEPHGAWISGPVSSGDPQDENNAPDWFDMLTVLCKSCGAALATESRAAEVGLPQQASFEDLLRALARIDEEAEEDEGVERCRPLQEPFSPSC